MASGIIVIIGSANGLFGTKLSSEPIMTNFQREQIPMIFFLIKIQKLFFRLSKFIWKFCVQIGDHFVQVSMHYNDP